MTPLRMWVGLRVGLLGATAAAFALAPGLLSAVMTRVPYAHGLAKGLLGTWMTVLYRLGLLPWVVGGAVLAALVLPALAGRRWLAGAALTAGLAGLVALDAAPVPLAVAVGLLLINLFPPARIDARWARRVAAIPLSEAVAFGPVAVALGLPPALHRGVVVVGAAWLAAAWLAIDAFVTSHARMAQINAWEGRTDPRVRVVERADPALACEYHDVDVAGDRVVVVAEGSHRLLAWPRSLEGPPATVKLPPMWGQLYGVTMDAETDPVSRTTWFLNGAVSLGAVTWDGRRFSPIQSSARFPFQLDHVYTRYLPEEGRVMLVSVNARPMPGLSSLVTVDVPAMRDVQVRRLRTPEDRPLEAIRDFEWLPDQRRLVLAPDFGDRLYLADPDTGRAEPWLAMPTLNGKLHYVPETGELYAALPDRAEVWVIDPKTARVVRTLPAQRGVRPVEVDPTRRRMITASVLTGQIEVRDLDDGRLLDRMGRVMPMVRELALLREEGVAVLSTWTVLYAFPYAEPAAAPRR